MQTDRAGAPLRGAAAVAQNPPCRPSWIRSCSRRCSAIRRGAGATPPTWPTRSTTSCTRRASSRRTCSRSSTTCSRPRAARLRPARGSQRSMSRGSTGGGSRRIAVPHRAAGVAHRLGREPRCRSTPRASGRNSLKPKSKLPSALVDAGRARRRRLRRLEVPRGHRQRATSAPTTASDPARRFHVFVKSIARGRGHLPGRGQAADRRDAGDAADRSDGRPVGEAHGSRRPATTTTSRSSSTTRRFRST